MNIDRLGSNGISRQLRALRKAEQDLDIARRDFERLRGSVDAAGELELYSRMEAARLRVRAIIGELDTSLGIDDDEAP